MTDGEPIQSSEAVYRTLFDEAPCGYVLAGSDGHIAMANDWLAKLLGYSTEELESMTIRDILSMAGRILYETNLLPLMRLQGTIGEVTIDLKATDKTAVPVMMSASATLDDAGALSTVRIVFVKASARRNYERELVSARDSARQGLADEKRDGELREQFVAVLGHDLRNPLASMSAATRILSGETLTPRATKVLGLMQGSIVRMTGLVENVLDFARSRLGAGIGLSMEVGRSLETLISQVVDELRVAAPDHEIIVDLSIDRPVYCDEVKIGQLISNLLGNAQSHGDNSQPIRLRAFTTDQDIFAVSVANGGTAIPEDTMARLFDPFVRGSSQGYRQGLGLGLYIASEIAKAHGGTLKVSSTDVETKFVFMMPIRIAPV